MSLELPRWEHLINTGRHGPDCIGFWLTGLGEYKISLPGGHLVKRNCTFVHQIRNERLFPEKDYGQGDVGGKDYRGQQFYRSGGRQSVLSAGSCRERIFETQQSHDGLFVEGNRTLLPCGSRRAEE